MGSLMIYLKFLFLKFFSFGRVLPPKKRSISRIRNLIMGVGMNSSLSHSVGEAAKRVGEPQRENNP